MSNQVGSGRIKLGRVESSQVGSGQLKLGLVGSNQVGSGRIESSPVWSNSLFGPNQGGLPFIKSSRQVGVMLIGLGQVWDQYWVVLGQLSGVVKLSPVGSS